MINKKGQGMSINTVILLVLGLILLGVLIFGFVTGWESFQKQIGKTNVDKIVEECSTSCSINQEFSFCNNDVDIRFQEQELEYRTSCGVLSKVPEFELFNVAECPRITCSVPCESIRINDILGEKSTEVKEGYHDVTDFASDVESGEFCLVAK